MVEAAVEDKDEIKRAGANTKPYFQITGDENFSWIRMLLIIGLVGCIVGLKLVSDAE